MSDEKIRCPKCQSDQIHASKKGFSTGKAVVGTVVGGVLVGAAAGGIGSGNIEITCLNCGHKFKPGGQFKDTAVIEKHFQDGYVKPIAKSEMEAIGRYKCHYCGKTTSGGKHCPFCGTPYKESDLCQDDLKIPKSGCLGVVLVVIVACWFLGT